MLRINSDKTMTDEFYEEVAMLLNENVLNAEFNASAVIEEIAFVETVGAGEHAYVYSDFDTDADTILAYDTVNDTITMVKRNPVDDTEISFYPVNSKDEYVTLQKVINTPDLKIFARKRNRILEAMNKWELYYAIAAIAAGTNKPSSVSMQALTLVSAEDLYDHMLRAWQTLRLRGDDFVMLAGTDVINKMESYEKDLAATNNYEVSIKKFLDSKRIKVIEVAEKLDMGSGSVNILAVDKFILLARKSSIDGSGKPIAFVRREIPATIAADAGAEVTAQQRLILIDKAPIRITVSGSVVPSLGYGIYAFAEVAIAIINPYSIVTSASLAAIL